MTQMTRIYEREGAFRPQSDQPTNDCHTPGFNSLQTGKHSQRYIPMKLARVSWSFNSLQTGKHSQRNTQMSIPVEEVKFPFPSNGKAYPKGDVTSSIVVGGDVFQFPSNGKGYPKHRWCTCCAGDHDHVSIPFKRESISKASLWNPGMWRFIICFHSLQTGKHSQSSS